MAAALPALDKHRGLRLRDANRPIPAPQKRVELEVTPDKAPTLRGVALGRRLLRFGPHRYGSSNLC